MGRSAYGYGQSSGMSMGAGTEIIHLIFGALFLVIVISLAIILVRMAMRGGRRGMWMQHMMSQGSAMEALKERYAKGEIDKREFDEKKKDLMSS